jgi:tetratricopeptide (TPR) repeat protein
MALLLGLLLAFAAPAPAQEAAPLDSAYLYSVSLLEGLRGHWQRSTALLKLAAESDTGSAYLREELVQRFQDLGMDPKAVQTLERAAQAAPQDLQAQLRLAQAYLARQQWEPAKAAYLKALALAPGDEEILRALGALALARGEDAEALDWLNRCLEAHPGSLQAHLLKAGCLAQMDRDEEAVVEYRAALALDPQASSAYLQLALLQSEMKQPEAAVGTLCLGLAAIPDDAGLIDTLARLELRQDHVAEAVAGFRDLVRLQPDSQDARLDLGLSLLRLGEARQARAAMEPLSATAGDKQALLLTALGMAADTQGDSLAAVDYLKSGLDLDPKTALSYGQLASLYERLSRTAEVAPLLERAVAQVPDNADLWSLLGAAYLDTDQAGLALQRLEKARTLGLDSPELHYQLAVACDRTGDTTTAERELDRVIEAQPNNAEALNYLGYSLADRNLELDKAMDLLKRAVALEPENPYYLDSLGWAWYRQGDRQRALYYLGRALELLKGARAKDREEVQAHLRAAQQNQPSLTPTPAAR